MKKWIGSVVAFAVVALFVGTFWFHIHGIWRAATYRFHEATVDFVTGDVEYRFFGITRSRHSFPPDVRDFLEEASLELNPDERFVQFRPGNHPGKTYPDYRGMRMARNSLWMIAAWRLHDPEVAAKAVRLYQEETLLGIDHKSVWVTLAVEARWNREKRTYVPDASLNASAITERNQAIEQAGRR